MNVSKDYPIIILEFERNRCPAILEFYDNCDIKYINGVTQNSFEQFFDSLTNNQKSKLYSNMIEKGNSLDKTS